MLHKQTPIHKQWTEENLPPFNELMISWNAARPLAGKFLFYVRVKIDQWSPLLLYASWGSNGQSSFQNATDTAPVRIYQDALEITQEAQATAFQIEIVTEGDAQLDQIHGLHVYIGQDAKIKLEQAIPPSHSIHLKVPGISQMCLHHSRQKDLWSPTATTAVTRYLSDDDVLDPVQFASQAWDSEFDMFGNWVLNVAEASVHLGPEWNCWVDRLCGFDAIYRRLQSYTPVIVSVRGPLPGSAQPYAHGHLIAVTGYDATHQRVLCMDPAFPVDNSTHVSYSLLDFTQAWKRRGNMTYVFARAKPSSPNGNASGQM